MSEQRSNRMPKGIPFIIGNEAAERFSYYGMKAILTVFMIKYLSMTQADATSWYHNFGSAVYAFPLVGALISDFFFGKYKTILSLSIVYCAGHLVLALFETQNGLLAGLTLIAIGSGGIKPCVSAHVGDQFTRQNQHLIDKVFSAFYFSINLGATVSSIATPWLLEIAGPSVAFGIPGGLMFIATFVFWLGRKKFVHIPARPKLLIQELSKKEGWFALGKLGLIYLFVAFFWALFDQTGSTWVIQAETDFLIKDISIFGLKLSLQASQLQSANPIMVMVLIPIFTWLIYPLVSKVVKLTAMRKIASGLIIAGFSFLIIASAEDQIVKGESVSMSYQIWAYLVLTVAEVLVSITALEFSYTQAPNSIKSIIMALYLLSVSLGNFVTSGINSWMEQPTSAIEVVSGEQTLISFDGESGLSVGDKIDINSKVGLYSLIPTKEGGGMDTIFLQGTYLIGQEKTVGKYELWDINRESVATQGDFKLEDPTTDWTSSYKLKGGAYFRFFAYMIFIVGAVFAVVAAFIKTKRYIQGDEEEAPAAEQV